MNNLKRSDRLALAANLLAGAAVPGRAAAQARRFGLSA